VLVNVHENKMQQDLPLLQQLIQSLRCIPGVGPKSAQRTAYYLLEQEREGAQRLAHTIQKALDQLKNCQNCRMLTEQTTCNYCQSTKRNKTTLCIVETPAELDAIEQTGEYQGNYFILQGKLSPPRRHRPPKT